MKKHSFKGLFTQFTSSIDGDYNILRTIPIVVYGYRKCRWRIVLVHILSIIICGIPYLQFHWCPIWLLSVQCCFQIADPVLVIETYQKKYKTYFIQKILEKNIADSSGLLNNGFEDEFGGEKGHLDSADDLYTPHYLDDGTTLSVQSDDGGGHHHQSAGHHHNSGSASSTSGHDSGQALRSRTPLEGVRVLP